MKTTISLILAFFCLTQTYCQVETEISVVTSKPNIISLEGKITARLATLSENSDNTDNETLVSSWNAYSKGYTTPGYYLDNDRVFFRGLLRKTGKMTAGEVIFILPLDYRPTGRKLSAGGQEGQNIRIDILANGEVKYMGGSNLELNFISLEGISFDIN